jgi:uncharacterized protein YuzE
MDDQLNFLYDHTADVLHISRGHPVFFDSVELNDQVILQLNPTSNEIVGFSIVDFMARFANSETPSTVPLVATFERVGRARQVSRVVRRRAALAANREAKPIKKRAA